VSASLKTAGGERPSSPPFLGGSAEETEVSVCVLIFNGRRPCLRHATANSLRGQRPPGGESWASQTAYIQSIDT
jgi:hypothetical protein